MNLSDALFRQRRRVKTREFAVRAKAAAAAEPFAVKQYIDQEARRLGGEK
jgi:hypothetical protein